jgi:hypothetical protein
LPGAAVSTKAFFSQPRIDGGLRKAAREFVEELLVEIHLN